MAPVFDVVSDTITCSGGAQLGRVRRQGELGTVVGSRSEKGKERVQPIQQLVGLSQVMLTRTLRGS